MVGTPAASRGGGVTLGVPLVPENVFPRQGEQCPVGEFSYKGYSPPKSTFNGNHTHTFKHKYVHSYSNVYMPYPMSRVLTDSLTHAFAMYEKLFSKQKIFVSENSLDNLRYQNVLVNPTI